MQQTNQQKVTACKKTRPRKSPFAGSLLKVIDVHNIRAAIYETPIASGDGEERKGVRILYGKRYQDKDGQWKTSTSFAPNEIHTAMYVLQRVDAYLAQRSSVRQRNRPRAPRSAHPAAGPDPEAYYAEMQGDEFLEII